jgi:inner membrane protein
MMEKNQNLNEERDQTKEVVTKKVPKKRSNIVITKLLSIFVMTLILLIPSAFILSIVKERKLTNDLAKNDTYQKRGAEQNISGPYIQVPIQKKIMEGSEQNEKKNAGYMFFLPKTLEVEGDFISTMLKRSIHKFSVFSSRLDAKGFFELKNYQDRIATDEELNWKEAKMIIHVSSIKGISKKPTMMLAEKNIELYPNPHVLKNQSTQSFESSVNLADFNQEKMNFQYSLDIRGNDRFVFQPNSESTRVKIKSNWPNPSFDGDETPISREVREDGFEAEWELVDFQFAKPYRSTFSVVNLGHNSRIGVTFLIPVDHYKETTRAVKYMILFIGLTFLGFFFVEITSQLRIHPIQYLFVGFALILFYLLLVSISEHVEFFFAYLIATLSTTSLIGLYSVSVLKSKKFASLISAKLILLYAFLYILLRNQDYSLLLGSCGLFVILGGIMYFTRNINWYRVDAESESSTN